MQTAIPMLLWCPSCNQRHVDAGDFATEPHHTHACQSCGMCWRPAVVPTVGVQFLPGFKDEPPVEQFQKGDRVRVTGTDAKGSFRFIVGSCGTVLEPADDASSVKVDLDEQGIFGCPAKDLSKVLT